MDIWAGILTVYILAAGLFFLGRWAGKFTSKWGTVLAGFLVVLAILALANTFQDSVFLARILPFPNVIVLGRWEPMLAGLLAGLVWRRLSGRAWRRCATVFLLMAAATYFTYHDLWSSRPHCGNSWQDGVCIQMSPASCSAAAAATLLRAYGIDATEAEMARLCFTTDEGTTLHGLFRGLTLKTAGTRWRAEVFSCGLEGLAGMNGAPVLLRVELAVNAVVDPNYEQHWGWVPGVAHTVVLFGFRENDKIEIGDPSVGRERWHVEALRVLWHGHGVRLVRRDGSCAGVSENRRGQRWKYSSTPGIGWSGTKSM